ncbi:MAG: hypothetical protein PF505_13950, partial [Vallitaleaceae bacterium]|nr:hypothetical protein [Vallitaleaceae bacterium]
LFGFTFLHYFSTPLLAVNLNSVSIALYDYHFHRISFSLLLQPAKVLELNPVQLVDFILVAHMVVILTRSAKAIISPTVIKVKAFGKVIFIATRCR